MMHPIWLAMTLFAAQTPAVPQPQQTVVIPLKHASAVDLDRLLLGADRNARRTLQDLSAWSILTNRNAVAITGAPETIAEVVRLVPLVDVPAIEIKVRVRVIPLDEMLTEQKLERESGQLIFRPNLRRADGVAPLLEFETTVLNGSALRLTGQAAGAREALSVVPRLNKDGTLMMSVEPGPFPFSDRRTFVGGPQWYVFRSMGPENALGITLGGSPGNAVILQASVLPAR